jgi:hypothetical protein
MHVMILDTSNCLLNYFFSTDPSPIQISTPQSPVNARINASVSSATGGDVYCNKILIAYPTGSDPEDIYSASPAGSLNTAGWSITSQMQTGRELEMGDPETDYTVFIYQCLNSANYLINYNLVFGAFGQTSLQTGDFQIVVQETSGTTSDPSTFTAKKGTFTLTKALPRFYLENFVATAPASPTVPATDFVLSTPIYFEWESNGTFYQIFQQNQTAPVYAGTVTNFTLSAGLTRDATFTLVAMVSGNPSGESGQGGFEPIFLYSALTITISNPVLTPSSVTAGSLAVTGNASVTGNTTLTGTLGVTGASTVGSLQAGGLSVTGNSTLNTASVNGTLGVTGATTVGVLTINNALSALGLATFSGGLQANQGPLSLINVAQSVNPGTYTAGTDGFAIGFCSWPSDIKQTSLGNAYGSTGNITVQATGGTLCLIDSGGSKYYGGNCGTFILPVNRGATWSVGLNQWGNTQAPAPAAFWWVPVGTAASSEEALVRIADAPDAEPVSLARLVPPPKPDYVPELVAVIESLTDKPITEETRHALTEVLTKMNAS